MSGPTTSQVCTAIDQLIALCREAVGPDVPVYDGPELTGDIEESLVVIGTDLLDPDTEWIAAIAEQEWGPLGRRARKETGTLYGLAVGWTGDVSPSGGHGPGPFKTARDLANASLAKIEAKLRGDGIQLNTPASILWADFQVQSVRQANTTSGALAYIPFAVGFEARLTGY